MKNMANAFEITLGGTVLFISTVWGLSLMVAQIEETTTTKVVVLIPPPVPPGDAPMNMAKVRRIRVGSLNLAMGMVLNPAVLGVTA